MNSPEHSSYRRDMIGNRISGMLFKFWHGYSIEENEQFKFWSSMIELLKVDGKVSDREWIIRREAELNSISTEISLSSGQDILAYGRARLEDYCRHQGVLPDGRVVTHIPAYLADREKLAGLGVLADNFARENIQESSDENLVVILPKDWSMRPADTSPDSIGKAIDPLRNERWAGVYNETDDLVINIFYNCKPFPYGDDFRSHTLI
jgi:hypothetical protein